jgi:hypothetical protein
MGLFSRGVKTIGQADQQKDHSFLDEGLVIKESEGDQDDEWHKSTYKECHHGNEIENKEGSPGSTFSLGAPD